MSRKREGRSPDGVGATGRSPLRHPGLWPRSPGLRRMRLHRGYNAEMSIRLPNGLEYRKKSDFFDNSVSARLLFGCLKLNTKLTIATK